VNGPRSIKQSVLTEVIALQAIITDSADQKSLAKVVGHLTSATDPSLWRDENHLVPKSGGRVFNSEKAAVQRLRKMINDPGSTAPDDLLSDWINRLVTVDQLLALISVDEAASSGAPPKKIAESRELIAKADADAAAERPTVAITRYRTAWKRVIDLQNSIAQ